MDAEFSYWAYIKAVVSEILCIIFGPLWILIFERNRYRAEPVPKMIVKLIVHLIFQIFFLLFLRTWWK